jgi:hypothetical protein
MTQSCGWLCRWRAATQLSGANADDEIVEVFWTAIGQLTQDERGMVRHHVSSYELWSVLTFLIGSMVCLPGAGSCIRNGMPEATECRWHGSDVRPYYQLPFGMPILPSHLSGPSCSLSCSCVADTRVAECRVACGRLANVVDVHKHP